MMYDKFMLGYSMLCYAMLYSFKFSNLELYELNCILNRRLNNSSTLESFIFMAFTLLNQNKRVFRFLQINLFLSIISKFRNDAYIFLITLYNYL